MLNNIGKLALVPRGRQRDGMPEKGEIIMRLVKEPLGQEELDMFMENNALIPNDWQGKIAIFWGATHSNRAELDKIGGATVIRNEEMWVKGIYFSGGLWHVESFPIDDDFSPRRLSAEIMRAPWWKRLLYRLIGKSI